MPINNRKKKKNKRKMLGIFFNLVNRTSTEAISKGK